MQVQSAADPPKKLALGERAVMADGNEYNIVPAEGERSRRSSVVYATEGTPLIVGPNGDLQGRAESECGAGCSRPSASRRNAQQLIVDVGGLRSVHPQTKEKAGRKPLKDIKTLKDDPAGGRQAGRRRQGALRQAVQGGRVTTLITSTPDSSSAPLQPRKFGLDMSTPLIVAFALAAMRPDPAADGLAVVLQSGRPQRRVHPRRTSSASSTIRYCSSRC